MQEELEQFKAVYQIITEFFVNYSFQLAGALVVLIIGVILARKAGRLTESFCLNKNLDITLSHFIGSTVRLIFIFMVIIITLNKIGISITPFIAAVGAISLGLSLAVQGLVSNYGAGLNIIISRPFVVGDTIRVLGVTGQVIEVTLGHTILTDEDQVRITIPNKHIIGEILHNSKKETLIEATIGIAYSSDIELALSTINKALASPELKAIEGYTGDETALVGIESFGDSGINIGIRFKAPTIKFFQTRYLANQIIFRELTAAQIDIPFPQREVKILQ